VSLDRNIPIWERSSSWTNASLALIGYLVYPACDLYHFRCRVAKEMIELLRIACSLEIEFLTKVNVNRGIVYFLTQRATLCQYFRLPSSVPADPALSVHVRKKSKIQVSALFGT
jgi:hypothetical protein